MYIIRWSHQGFVRNNQSDPSTIRHAADEQRETSLLLQVRGIQVALVHTGQSLVFLSGSNTPPVWLWQTHLFSQDPPCLQNQDKPEHLTEYSQFKDHILILHVTTYPLFLHIIWPSVVRLISVFQFVVATTSSWFFSFFCFTLTPHQLSCQNLPCLACPAVFYSVFLPFPVTWSPHPAAHLLLSPLSVPQYVRYINPPTPASHQVVHYASFSACLTL